MKNFILLLLCFSGIDALAQQKLIKVNRSMNAPEEVSIAINPVHPNCVAASSNINNYYYSINGGSTWKEKKVSSKHGVWGDPMVHFDAFGNLYFAHLGKNPEKYFPNWIDNMVVQRINMSYDSCFADASIGFNNGKIQDKEWLSSNLKGTLFMTWTEFDRYESKDPNDHSRIRFSQSEDFGTTWAKPIVVSDKEGDCLDGDSTMEGATSCSDSKGNIYVCWSGINKLWFDKSTSGGKSFGADKIIATQYGGWNVPVRHLFRANGMPFILCNQSASNYKDRLYVNWTDTRNGDADIFLKYSDDGGETWSNDIRVNNDVLGNGADQFCNNFSIDAVTGELYIVFYDKRNSRTGAYVDVYLAKSMDGGNHWTNYRITSKPFPAPGKTEFFGDYIDVDAYNGIIMPIFTSNDNGQYNVYTCHVDTTLQPEAHSIDDIQAVVLNDSLYIHAIVPKNRSFVITVSYNNTNINIAQDGGNETEFVFNARGFMETKITLKYGRKKKSIKVKNKPRS